ncbi:MAG: GTP 3',8-cyclase MoaA [Myxococcaceae bacterium]
MPLLDALDRPLRNLRISVTDRCNLRCQYCMPEKDYAWLPREDLLTFEEIARVVDAFMVVGVDRVRLTGGEPLVRRDLDRLVEQLAGKGLKETSLTTNGLLLASQARTLKAAGLTRVTVSLDTLRPARFLALTRRDEHAAVLKGIDAVNEAGFSGLKLDAVIIRGINDDELEPLLAFGRKVNAEVRFIEYMDVGGATQWTSDRVVGLDEIVQRLQARPLLEESSSPARRFATPEGTVFGVIASTTRPFCRRCDRSRITADGLWLTCLYGRSGKDLRSLLRRGEDLIAVLRDGWSERKDRGAEERLQLMTARSPLLLKHELERDPHLEMHTRGG